MSRKIPFIKLQSKKGGKTNFHNQRPEQSATLLKWVS
jgi:hypothetical protein